MEKFFVRNDLNSCRRSNSFFHSQREDLTQCQKKLGLSFWGKGPLFLVFLLFLLNSKNTVFFETVEIQDVNVLNFVEKNRDLKIPLQILIFCVKFWFGTPGL